MAKEELSTNTYTKEERPRTGDKKSNTGYGRGTFGMSKYGQVSGYEMQKEPLQSKIS